jgi:hypothetical protein
VSSNSAVVLHANSDTIHPAAADERLQIAHNGDAAAWTNFVGQINKSIDRLDLEFRNVHDEATGIEMYILVIRSIPYPGINCSPMTSHFPRSIGRAMKSRNWRLITLPSRLLFSKPLWVLGSRTEVSLV